MLTDKIAELEAQLSEVRQNGDETLEFATKKHQDAEKDRDLAIAELDAIQKANDDILEL